MLWKILTVLALAPEALFGLWLIWVLARVRPPSETTSYDELV